MKKPKEITESPDLGGMSGTEKKKEKQFAAERERCVDIIRDAYLEGELKHGTFVLLCAKIREG